MRNNYTSDKVSVMWPLTIIFQALKQGARVQVICI